MDSKAIAFECSLESEWNIIRYIVREALDAVHDALKKHAITEIMIDWLYTGQDLAQGMQE